MNTNKNTIILNRNIIPILRDLSLIEQKVFLLCLYNYQTNDKGLSINYKTLLKTTHSLLNEKNYDSLEKILSNLSESKYICADSNSKGDNINIFSKINCTENEIMLHFSDKFKNELSKYNDYIMLNINQLMKLQCKYSLLILLICIYYCNKKSSIKLEQLRTLLLPSGKYKQLSDFNRKLIDKVRVELMQCLKNDIKSIYFSKTGTRETGLVFLHNIQILNTTTKTVSNKNTIVKQEKVIKTINEENNDHVQLKIISYCLNRFNKNEFGCSIPFDEISLLIKHENFITMENVVDVCNQTTNRRFDFSKDNHSYNLNVIENVFYEKSTNNVIFMFNPLFILLINS